MPTRAVRTGAARTGAARTGSWSGCSRRWAVTIVASAAVTLLPSTGDPAHAASIDCDEALLDGAVRCVVDESWIRQTSTPGAGDTVWPPEGWRLVSYPIYDTDSDGEACLRRITRYLAPSEPMPVGETAPWFEFNHPSSPPDDISWDDCPPRAGDEPPDLDLVLERLTSELRRQLPAPELSIAPQGTALTGLPAHLDTGERQLTFTDVLTIPHGGSGLDVDFTASGSYLVDWGDESPLHGPLTVPGGPYPDGQVRHAYRSSGSYAVRVVDDWDVRVEVPGLPPMPLGYEVGHPPIEVRAVSLKAVRVASR